MMSDNGILLSQKKDEILPFATWMDLEDIMLNEISQMEKDKYHMISLPCGRFKKTTKTNKHIDTENRLVVTGMKEEREEGKRRKRAHLYSDKWQLDFGGKHNGVYTEVEI